MCPLLTVAVVSSASSWATWRFIHWIVGAGWYSIPLDPFPQPKGEVDGSESCN